MSNPVDFVPRLCSVASQSEAKMPDGVSGVLAVFLVHFCRTLSFTLAHSNRAEEGSGNADARV